MPENRYLPKPVTGELTVRIKKEQDSATSLYYALFIQNKVAIHFHYGKQNNVCCILTFSIEGKRDE